MMLVVQFECDGGRLVCRGGAYGEMGQKQREKVGWTSLDRRHYFLTMLDVSDKMWSDQMSNSSSERAITSFHLVSCFMHLSLTVSHSFISVISSSRQHICVSSISASKERKSEGDRPVSYDDDKYACRLHLIEFLLKMCVLCKQRKWKDLQKKLKKD